MAEAYGQMRPNILFFITDQQHADHDDGDAPPPELAEVNRSPFTAEDYGWEFRRRWEHGNRSPVPAPYYGFDEVELVVGHGDRCTGHEELRNLWDDPGHAAVRSDLLLRLVHEMQAHAERSPHPLSIA